MGPKTTQLHVTPGLLVSLLDPLEMLFASSGRGRRVAEDGKLQTFARSR